MPSCTWSLYYACFIEAPNAALRMDPQKSTIYHNRTACGDVSRHARVQLQVLSSDVQRHFSCEASELLHGKGCPFWIMRGVAQALHLASIAPPSQDTATSGKHVGHRVWKGNCLRCFHCRIWLVLPCFPTDETSLSILDLFLSERNHVFKASSGSSAFFQLLSG